MSAEERYPSLAGLISGWFHQDFDLSGNSLAEIVDAFRRVSNAAQLNSLRSDIRRFIDDHPDRLDDAFLEAFRPDVDPKAFASSARAFLDAILRQLDGN